MQTEKINNWEQKQQALQQKFPFLKGEDLVYEIGREKELLKKLQEKLNINEGDLAKWLRLMG